jgi:hypothetical protein
MSDNESDHKNPLRRAVGALIGDPDRDRTDPHPVRGWEQPLEEQQLDPPTDAAPDQEDQR